MDLEELLGQEVIHEDKWSRTGPTFGKDNQIKVLGWIHKSTCGLKSYLIHCSTCAQDPELFGEGYFRIRKWDLIKNLLSCGCGRRHKWSEAQYKIKIARALAGSCVTFTDWSEPFDNSNTRMKLTCDLHGEFETAMTIGNHLSRGVNAGMCLQCSDIKTFETKTQDRGNMIREFISTRGYQDGTTVNYLGTEEHPVTGEKSRHWEVYCPLCNITYTTRTAYLMRLGMRCDCSRKNQTKAYINKIYDGQELVFLKFGISSNPYRRNAQIQGYTDFHVILTDVFLFDTAQDCREAENLCKQTLECRVIDKEIFRTGYTETVSIDDYDSIVKIYESFGGKRLDLTTLCD